MHLPAHPLWFWLIVFSPVLIWSALWAIARFGRASLKPLTPWLTAGAVLSAPASIGLDASDDHKALRLVAQAVFYTCLVGLTLIQRRYMFETLRGNAKWYVPWSSARFSISQNARIHVRDIDSVAPWYVDTLGLHKELGTLSRDSETATYKFKEDGKSITLTTRMNYGTHKTLILFTKNIDKMKSVLCSRGTVVGQIEQDRQGTRYFEIHDPEGNVIEIVEER